MRISRASKKRRLFMERLESRYALDGDTLGDPSLNTTDDPSLAADTPAEIVSSDQDQVVPSEDSSGDDTSGHVTPGPAGPVTTPEAALCAMMYSYR